MRHKGLANDWSYLQYLDWSYLQYADWSYLQLFEIALLSIVEESHRKAFLRHLHYLAERVELLA